LLDRFGLSVEVTTPKDLQTRVDIVRRRDAFERDRAGFTESYKRKESALRRKILRGREALGAVVVPDAALERAASLCMALGTDGLRGELTLIRAARALAALEGHTEVTDVHIRRVAPSALRHRLRRDPLDDVSSSVRVDRLLEEAFAA
jgi:magnesium chelatase subunit I